MYNYNVAELRVISVSWQQVMVYYFNTCAVHLLLFCAMNQQMHDSLIALGMWKLIQRETINTKLWVAEIKKWTWRRCEYLKLYPTNVTCTESVRKRKEFKRKWLRNNNNANRHLELHCCVTLKSAQYRYNLSSCLQVSLPLEIFWPKWCLSFSLNICALYLFHLTFM